MSSNLDDLLARLRSLSPEERAGVLAEIQQSGGVSLGVGNTIAQMGDAIAGDKIVQITYQLPEAITGQRDAQALLAQIRAEMQALPERLFDLYLAVVNGLGRASVDVTVDPLGQIELRNEHAPAARPTDLRAFQELLAALRWSLLRPDAPPPQAELDLRRTRYRALIIAQCQALRLEGLSTGTRPIVLPLEQVYVQLRAVAEVPEAADAFTPEERRLLSLLEEEQARGRRTDEALREAHLRLDAIRRERWTRERLERFPLGQALRDPLKRGLVILGDPGSGKSTLLQFLALVFARGPEAVAQHLHIQGPDADRLPILAPLASYDDMLNETPDLTVQEFLARYYDRRRAAPGLAAVFDQQIAEGRALIMLDGLDEVIDERRRAFVAEQATRFVQSALAAGNRVVLTSRVYGYRAAPLAADLPHITVLDFRQEEIALFARQWFRALLTWEHGGTLNPQAELLAQQEERRLLAEIRTNPGVERLAVNPLLLTMLALLRRQVGTLPQRRIKLYDLYATALIENWEDHRSRGARLHGVAPRVDPKEAERVLIALALWLQQHRPSGTASAGDLLSQLAEIYLWEDFGLRSGTGQATLPQRRQAEERARRFLHDMRQYAGLLIERGLNAFGFRHLTFQEYFAGRALARLPAQERWDLLAPNRHSGRWREPLLLCAARLGVSESRDAETADLVARLLEASSDYEDLLHRDLFLAADCAADDIGLAPPLLQRIAGTLWPLRESPLPGVAIGALRRLHRLTLLRAGAGPRLPETQAALLEALLELCRRAPQLGNDRVVDEAHDLLRRLPLDHDTGLRAAFLACLDDESWDVRATALAALGPLAASHADVRAALLDRLGQGRVDVPAALGPLAASDREVRDVLMAGMSNPRWDVRVAALEVLAPLAITDLAVRVLLRLGLADLRWEVRAAAVEALAPLAASDREVREALLLRLEDSQREVRASTLVALGPLATGSADIRALLLRHLNDDAWNMPTAALGMPPLLAGGVALRTLAGLAGSDPFVRAALLGLLRDPRWDMRAAALDVLAPWASSDADVRAGLLARLEDESWGVRAAAVTALGPLAATDRAVRADLLRLLDDEWWELRSVVIATLSGLLPHARDVAEALRRLLDHQDWRTRRHTLQALAPTLHDRQALQALLALQMHKRLCYESQPAQLALLKTLGVVAGEDLKVRDALLDRLRDPSWHVRAVAMEALGPLAEADPGVRLALLARLDDEWWELRAAALAVLRPLVGEDGLVRVALLERLNDPRWNVQAAAIRTLAPLAATDNEVRAALLKRLGDESWDVRTTVAQALGPLAADREVRAALLHCLDDEWWAVQSSALRSLGPLASSDPEVRAALLLRLRDARWDVRAVAVQALGPLASSDPEVRATLLAALDDDDHDVWSTTLEALGPLAASDLVVRASLLARLLDPRWDLRVATLEALKALAGRDRDVRMGMLACLSDMRWDVRKTALQTLGALVGIDAEVRAALLGHVDDVRWEMRAAVLGVLGPHLPADSEMRAALLLRLADDDNYVRAAAAGACRAAARTDTEVRAALLPLLLDAALGVRTAALDVLSPLAASDDDVRLALIAGLGSPWKDVRVAVLAALGPLASTDRRVRTALLSHLGDSSWGECAAAITALGPLAATDAAVRSALLMRTSDARGDVRLAATGALGPLAATDAGVCAALLARLDDPWGEVQSSVLRALGPLASQHAGVRATLLARGSAAAWDQRVVALNALAPCLADDAGLLAYVASHLQDPSMVVRLTTISCLTPLVGQSTSLYRRLFITAGRTDAFAAIRAAGEYLPSEELEAVRKQLTAAYGELVRSDAACRADVIAALGSEDWRQRKAAIDMLAVAGTDAVRQARPQLLEALKDWRGLDALPARLEAAALLVNDHRYGDEALATVLPALTYGADEVLPVPGAADVRRQAALALAKLKAPAQRRDAAGHVAALLREEREPQVLDALLDALLALSSE
ncbi:MAG: hypothetical protein OHK0022_19760 [Roseiflexaceae bacterium]